MSAIWIDRLTAPDAAWAGVRDRLRARGLRWTPQRRTLIEVLSQTDGHVTGAELVERCREVDPATIPSTVYRTLDVLEELGLLSHSHAADGREEFHVLPAAVHGHLHCIGCAYDLGDRRRRGGRAGRVDRAAAGLRGRRHPPVDRRAMYRLHGVSRDGGHQERGGRMGELTGDRVAAAAEACIRAVERVVPGPGQESVWDYPRPPRVEAVPERLRVIVDGEVLAETTQRLPGPRDRRGAGLLLPAATTSGWTASGRARTTRSASGRATRRTTGTRRRSARIEQRRLVLPGPEARLRGDPRPPRVLRRAGWTRRGSATSERRRSRAASTAAGSRRRIVGPIKGEPGSPGW